MDKELKIEKVNIHVYNSVTEQIHFHQTVELIYVLEGDMHVEMDDQKIPLSTGDIYVINANKRHALVEGSHTLFADITISFQLISNVLHTEDFLFVCSPSTSNSEKYDVLRTQIQNLIRHYYNIKMQTDNFGYIGLCYQVLDTLVSYFLEKNTERKNWSEKDRLDHRINEITNYIRTYYNQPISLNDLAGKFYLSNSYMSRYFKKTYGMTFVDYLTNIRLYHALDDLMYTSYPITRIASDNGFSSVAAFNVAYKKYQGETPSETRKKLKVKEQSNQEGADSAQEQHVTDTEEQLVLAYLKHNGEPRPAQTMNTKTILCSTSQNQGAFKQFHTINIGAASDLLKSEVQEHLLILKSLGFRYVRFWNIFCDEMLLKINSENEDYNFTKLDSILDFLVEQGLKPHFELGSKPKELYNEIGNAVYFHDEAAETYDAEKWELLLQHLMRHLVRRYGSNELDTWRMELWLHEVNSDWPVHSTSYFTQFDLLYRTVRQYCHNLKIGGCGLRADNSEEQTTAFLQLWMQREIQPDFISSMFYAYYTSEEDYYFACQNPDQDAFLHDIQKLHQVMTSLGMKQKLYITEFNLTISDRNYINDTCFKGAYILKNMIQVYDYVDDVVYYVGSDRTTEHFDSGLLLHGGRGILSKDSILKPAGFALDFWQRQYPELLSLGASYIITKNDYDSYGILCQNQKHLNYGYYMEKEHLIEKENICRYYEDLETNLLHFQLSDLVNGIYKIRIFSVNELYGSIMSIWEQTDFETELSKNDITYLRRVCEPNLTIRKVEVTNGVLDVKPEMRANQISFIQISRMI